LHYGIEIGFEIAIFAENKSKLQMTKSIYRAYAFFMFSHLSQILKKGIGIKIDIYPCEDGKNTVVIITFKDGEKHDVDIHEGKSMAESLVIAGAEHLFYQIDGAKVDGTNTIVFSDRIVYIKGNNVESFSEDAVRSNVMALAKHRMGMA
jgi:hypothetical protein